MNIVTITNENIDNEHICCAIGNDKENLKRVQTKKEWMKQQFKNGLVFKRLDERGKVFIEYMPIENVWKPISGKNYLVINCLWVSGKFKGEGFSKKLLDECILDAKKQGKVGVAVVSSSKVKPFLTDKKFYEKQGFVTVDTAPPYFELLALKFNPDAENPSFTKNARSATCSVNNGFAFFYSSQCPFMEEYVALLSGILAKKNIPYVVKKFESAQEARENGSPFGTLGIFYNGKFVTHELMPEKKFEKWLEEFL